MITHEPARRSRTRQLKDGSSYTDSFGGPSTPGPENGLRARAEALNTEIDRLELELRQLIAEREDLLAAAAACSESRV